MRPEDRGMADSFFEGLCMYRDLIYVLFMVSLLLFVLSLVSFAVVEPGTETHVIVVMNLVGLGALLLVSGSVLVKCRESTGQ